MQDLQLQGGRGAAPGRARGTARALNTGHPMPYRDLLSRSRRLAPPAVLLTLALGGAACSPSPDAPRAGPSPSEPAPAPGPDEEVLSTDLEHLPATGRTLRVSKILDRERMTVRDDVVDFDTGKAVDLVTAHAEEREAFRELHGVDDPVLAGELARAPIGARVGAEVVLEPDVDASTMAGQLAVSGAEILAQRPRSVAVRAVREVLTGLANLPGVEAVGRLHERKPLALSAALDLGQAPLALAHRRGAGRGILTALWEPDACVNRSHPDFRSVTWQPRAPATACSAFAGWVSGHSTAVAGVLAADRSGTATAGMFAGTMFDVDDNDPAAVTSMWTRDPRIVNASFAISAPDGKMIDTEVYRRGAAVFNGSGNDPSDTANCWAYNAICVGGYSMNGTPGAYGDDSVSPGASYLNYFGREGPQLLGTYQVAMTAHHDGRSHAAGHGTSFSTPAVAGLGGLLMANYPSALSTNPSLLRAVLMASAHAHPVVSAGLRVPRFSDTIDDAMGVGVPNGSRARSILSGNAYVTRTATPSTLGLVASFPVSIGDSVRVVLTWDQCPDYATFAPELLVDLDLMVRIPGTVRTTQIATNVSRHDNWEVVELSALRSGTVELHVSASRFGACSFEGGAQRVPMSVAWTKVSTTATTF
jgi:hypothetical protein